LKSNSTLPSDLADALANARARLPERIELRHFADVDSTNEAALKLAAAGAPEGTAVMADAQHAGRGRRGRVWFSPPGAGLYLSGVVRRAGLPPTMGLVTLAAGIAAARAITAATALPVELKWPNDLVVGRPWRKLGGILCESVSVGSSVDALVVGIGVNLRAAAYPPDLRRVATSIEVELGRPVDRAILAVECIAQLLAIVDRLRAGDAAVLLDEWRMLGRAGLDNAPVRWHDQDGERRGRARDIAPDGALIVDSGGATERILSGEVTWETST
jgi:BirA family biotin operon repressor/biotin-[acetyl-CoA-carboxylase] ligase